MKHCRQRKQQLTKGTIIARELQRMPLPAHLKSPSCPFQTKPLHQLINSLPHLTLNPKSIWIPIRTMDGLIKGLIDVALGRDDDDRDEADRSSRSRSTWAEVATGEGDNDNDSWRRRSRHEYQQHADQWNRQYQGENEGRRNEEWEGEGSGSGSGSRPSRLPEKDDYGRDEYNAQEDYGRNTWGRKEDVEEVNDGWQTVGKKQHGQENRVHMDHWNGYKRPPSEQEYSNEVDDSASLEPAEVELADLSKACNRLWELDYNRLVPGQDYRIDVGEGTKVYQKEDMAQGNLFSYVSENVLRRPTFSRFCSLLDNYNPNEGSREVVTSEERQEQAAFIEEISRTAPIKYLHKYLASQSIVPESYDDFKQTLERLWFDLYNRGGTSGSSSAFEHVFVGEIKQRGEQEVSGFHNWLQFYLEESKGTVDYQGYIFPRRHGVIPDSENLLLTIQFEWNGVLKSVSSTLVGVSPEFEVALYTLCFYVGCEDNHVELGPYAVNIKCYRFGDRIGSVFPIAES